MFGITKQNKGYTLIELVVYVAILAVVFVIVVSSLVSVYRSFLRARVERNLSESGRASMEIMVRDIRAATSTEVAASVFEVHPGVLDLRDKTFSLSGDTLERAVDGGSVFALTSSSVKATNLVFYRSATSTSEGIREIIKVELGLEAGEGEFLKTRNFYGSAVLRGAY